MKGALLAWRTYRPISHGVSGPKCPGVPAPDQSGRAGCHETSVYNYPSPPSDPYLGLIPLRVEGQQRQRFMCDGGVAGCPRGVPAGTAGDHMTLREEGMARCMSECGLTSPTSHDNREHGKVLPSCRAPPSPPRMYPGADSTGKNWREDLDCNLVLGMSVHRTYLPWIYIAFSPCNYYLLDTLVTGHRRDRRRTAAFSLEFGFRRRDSPQACS